MLAIKEWKWEKPKPKKQGTFTCPYCNGVVTTFAETRIVDVDKGAIPYHIYKCPQCHMPVTIGIDGQIIPPSLFLPFEPIGHLPLKIKKMYEECGRAFLNECYHSVIIVAHSLMMQIAIEKGAEPKKAFKEYVTYLRKEGYIAENEKVWVDKIRELGERCMHGDDIAIKTDAYIAFDFVSQVLRSIYEMPARVREG